MYQCASDRNIADLLRQLRRLHLRPHDLERDHLPGRLRALVSLCAMAYREAAFSQRRPGGIVDARGLGDYRRRRFRVDRHVAEVRAPGAEMSKSLR